VRIALEESLVMLFTDGCIKIAGAKIPNLQPE
jgi:hypothetical protein